MMFPASRSTGASEAPREQAARAEPWAVSLDSWISHDWKGGVRIDALEPLGIVRVRTRNSVYEMIVTGPAGDVRVRGGRYFQEWTPARFAGSTTGGSFLKGLTIHAGLGMEFHVGTRRIVTSPVGTIALLPSPPTV